MPTLPNDPPLIVTALLGAACFDSLERLRQEHFPAALNKVPAHLSLFHHLPGAAARRVVALVGETCRERSAFDMPPLGVRLLGRGVAIAYDGRDLLPVHAALRREWESVLTPQDRQPFKPHVTVQNKVEPAAARSLADDLRQRQLPTCRVEGLMVWRYLGGPWEAFARCPFAA